jgi:hypothetical protein
MDVTSYLAGERARHKVVLSCAEYVLAGGCHCRELGCQVHYTKLAL